jgi:hypothetical protein
LQDEVVAIGHIRMRKGRGNRRALFVSRNDLS